MTLASRLFEGNGGDVGTLNNLGAWYCDLGRPRDAIAAIDRIVEKPSAYGLTQVQLRDAEQTVRSLDYLRAHLTDSQTAYRDALIVTNQLDSAAKLLIAQLLDPGLRLEALQEVQDYAEPKEPAWAMEMRTRERSVIARSDVQAAIKQVGRMEHYHIESEW